MHRYFFDVTNGSTLADEVGEEFELVEAARWHAMAVARELSRNRLPLSLVGRFISVVDEGGIARFFQGAQAAVDLGRKLSSPIAPQPQPLQKAFGGHDRNATTLPVLARFLCCAALLLPLFGGC
jgi:Domain of unknown function (DUF6894)